MSFESFSFDRRIVAGITACGYETPTPIQSQAIPAVLKGQDVLGLAQTGTGKTAAFALPILQHLIDADASRRGPVRVLVLAPTRELALQIQETFVSLGKQTGFRSASVFGGVGIVPQIKALRNASIAVACPGRLLDLISRGECDLSQVDTLVLDEADRMFDMGFLPDLKRILARLPAQRQNLLFSATMPNEVRGLANELLQNPVTLQVNHTVPKTSIEHVAYNVQSRQKGSLLEALLKDTKHDSVLIFTRTKHRAKSVARILGDKGWRATSLQGNLSQNRRQEALDGFRAGKYDIMVATDIAARGIDCASISHVINFDLPDTPETYTHRIGRTGRADKTGIALTLVASEDNSMMRSIERTLGNEIVRLKLEGFAYGAQTAQDESLDRPDTRGRGGRYGKPEGSRGFTSGARGNGGGGFKSGRINNGPSAERSSDRSDDRPFGKTVDRQRSGMRSPYADQAGSDAPRYGRVAKPAFGARTDKPVSRFGASEDDKPKRFGRQDRDERRPERSDDRGERRPFGNRDNDRSSFGRRDGAPAGERRFDRSDRPGQPNRTERNDRNDRNERSDRNDRFGARSERPANSERGGYAKPSQHRKGESFAKPDSGSLPLRKRVEGSTTGRNSDNDRSSRTNGEQRDTRRTRAGYR